MNIDINKGVPNTQMQTTGETVPVTVNKTEPTTQQAETGRPSALDTVSLTDSAKQMQKMEATVADMPVVDSQKVEHIKQAIAEGKYEIDPVIVADKMVEFEAAIDSLS